MILWGNILPVLRALLCACALRPALGHFLGLHPGASSCTLYRTSLRGTCQSIYDCPLILQNIRRFTPTVCFLQGRIPYVCCPKLSSSTTDVSPPAISFTCGTTDSKPATRILQEVSITRALHTPAVRAFFPGQAGFAPLPIRSLPSSLAVRVSSLESLGVNFLISQGIDSLKNSWPWMALLGYRSKSSPSWECGGVLINELWVLTASHCVIKELVSVVRLGEHDLSKSDESPHQDFGVKDTVFHPEYHYPQGYHDLALLKLDQTVKIKKEIRPICLPWGKQEIPSVGTVITVTGWGHTFFRGTRSNILQEATLQMVESQECVNGFSTLSDYSSTFPRGITSDLLCIGDKDGEGQDACQGDSGGPVMIRKNESYVLTGIVSSGYGCSNPDFPGLYASVHHAPDLAWIKRVAF